MNLLQANIDVTSSNELSLIVGLVVTALFYLQYRRYESEMKKNEMIDRFLN